MDLMQVQFADQAADRVGQPHRRLARRRGMPVAGQVDGDAAAVVGDHPDAVAPEPAIGEDAVDEQRDRPSPTSM